MFFYCEICQLAKHQRSSYLEDEPLNSSTIFFQLGENDAGKQPNMSPLEDYIEPRIEKPKEQRINFDRT